MRKRWRSARPAGRVIAVVLLAVVLAAAGTGIWWFAGRDSASAATTAATTTRDVAASLTTMQKSVSGTGTLTPKVKQDVSFAVSGTVTAVDVAAGATVTAGQALASVDTLQLNADLLSAKATLATDQAKLADLQAASTGTAAQVAQIAAASAQVAVAQSQVDSATTALSQATLTAPVAGLVTTVNVVVGQKVTGSSTTTSTGTGTGTSGGASASGSSGTSQGAGSQGGTGSAGGSSSSASSGSSSAQFTIVGTDAYQVSVGVSDSDIAKVAVGDQVEMTSTSLSGTVFGTVSSIGLLSTSSGVASYPVVVDVTGDVSKLHDGISVTAAIVYERRADVLAVPTAAVTTANGTSTVQKVDAEGAVQTVEVQVGETSGQLTEITSGLVEGDLVREVTYTRSATGSGTQRGYGGYGGSGGTRGYGNGGTGQFPGGFPDQGGHGGQVGPGAQSGQGGQQVGMTGSRSNG